MSRLAFVVSAAAMIFAGWLYFMEIGEVNATKTNVAAAADSTALKLAQSSDPERNTDADAASIFKTMFPSASVLDEVAVRQSLQPLSSGRFRQSVTVSGRARTTLSEFFNVQGAEIEIVATHDFDHKK